MYVCERVTGVIWSSSSVVISFLLHMSSSARGRHMFIVRVQMKMGVGEIVCSRVKDSLRCHQASGLSLSCVSPLIHLTDSGRNSSLPEPPANSRRPCVRCMEALCPRGSLFTPPPLGRPPYGPELSCLVPNPFVYWIFRHLSVALHLFRAPHYTNTNDLSNPYCVLFK